MDANPKHAWAPVARVRTHEQVLGQIESQILSGQLHVGDHLPSERELSAMLGISRTSLRESLRVLEALGVLDVRRGGGPEGGAVLADAPRDAPIEPLALQLALGHFNHREIVGARLALETWSCERAAESGTDADFAAMGRILARMEARDLPVEEFNALDAAFHVRIAEASGNSLTARLMITLRRAINRQMEDAYARLSDWEDTAEIVCAEHRAILEALTARDGAQAALLVRRHIETFYDNVPVEGFDSGEEKT